MSTGAALRDEGHAQLALSLGGPGEYWNRCNAPGCPRPTRRRTALYCDSHYARLRHGKSLEAPIGQVEQPARSVRDRFEDYYEPDPTTGCWLWTGRTNSMGYGQLTIGSRRVGDRRAVPAHRLSYELHVGPIPDGLFICHHCDTPGCVNPDHLFPGTPTDNMRDMASKGRSSNQKKTHCPQGHPYDEANTVWLGPNHRVCRTCSNKATREANWRRRGKT